MDVVVAVDDVLLAHEFLEQRNGGLDAVDDEFVERALEPHQALTAGLAMHDQFADERVIEKALLHHGQKMQIEQRPRAESDIAVAAASILARVAFINWLERKAKDLGMKLGRGASSEIRTAAANIVEKHGPQMLSQIAKVHFRTAHEVAPSSFPAPPSKRPWVR